MHHDDTVVKPNLSFSKTCFAEARADGDLISLAARIGQTGLHGVEIAVAPRPEMHTRETFLSGERSRVTCGDELLLASELGHRLAVVVKHLNLQSHLLCLFRCIDDLRLHIGRNLASLDVVGRAIDVSTYCSQVAIERKGLVNVIRHVEIDILGQSAHVHVEVLVVPLERGGSQLVVGQVVAVLGLGSSLGGHQLRAVGILLLVGPVVVGQHLKAVLTSYI